MGNKEALQLFGEKRIRTAWNQEEEKWYFSIVDVCAARMSAYFGKTVNELFSL